MKKERIEYNMINTFKERKKERKNRKEKNRIELD